GSKVDIYKLMENLAAGGAGIIMVSSELLEVMNVPHRIAVVYNGTIVKEFRRGDATEEQVMSHALGFGGKAAS
ncbi:MAG TPA: D-xylose ABC transporter ATP-binding protein, partial [Spirochaetia bacterium]|nr:D-xylose ABC transporter ATP-binding protein [Spirochaetia bacterium]